MNEKHTSSLSLLEFFRYYVVGKNAKGIVHNLNGPLQVISMNAELLNMELQAMDQVKDGAEVATLHLKQAKERMEQLEKNISMTARLVMTIDSRTDLDGEEEETPLMLSQILEETVEFWKFDLFFKHQIDKQFNIPKVPQLVLARERALKNMLDGIMFGTIELLKSTDKPWMKFSILSEPESDIRLIIEVSSPIYPVKEFKKYRDNTGKDDHSCLDFCTNPIKIGFVIAMEAAKDIPAVMDMMEDSITIAYKGSCC